MTTKTNSYNLKPIEDFFIGGIAAGLSKTAAAPMERVKIMLQNQEELIKYGRLDKSYKGITDCIKDIYYKEGLLSFWRGNSINVIRYFTVQALNFGFKDYFKGMFYTNNNNNNNYIFDKYINNKIIINIISGASAGVSSLIIVYSLDYVRTRLASDTIISKQKLKHQFTGIIDVYKQTLLSDGITGLYRGFIVSIIGISVYRGCYFGLYDSIKPHLPDNNFIYLFCLGYSVTLFSGFMSYPFDTIRRRMMMTTGEKQKYSSSYQCAKYIIRNEGFYSLYNGLVANRLRGFCGAGALAGFDKLKQIYISHTK